MGRTKVRGVELGGVRLAVEVPPGFAWQWPARWFPELTCSPYNPDVYVGVRVGVTAVPRFDAIAYSCYGGSFEIGRVGEDWVVVVHGRERFERVAWFDDCFRQGEIVISPRALSSRTHAVDHPLQHPLDDLIVMHRVIHGGGLVLRGSALVRNGSALVFLGAARPPADPLLPRGSAKYESEMLAHDQVVLQREGSGMRAYGTPWRVEAPVPAPLSAHLEALYVMSSSRNGISARRLDPEGALSELLSHAYAPVHDAASAERQLEAARRVADRVPLLVLERPERSEERVISFGWGHRQAALGFAPPPAD